MGRPNKFDLQYFPVDVTFWDDHKIISIEEDARIQAQGNEKAGIIAGYIAMRLIAMAYGDQGYYLEWPDKFEMTAAKRIGNGITGAEVKAVFELCLQHELFDRKTFENHQVLTSRGIQKRWKTVMTLLRRKTTVDQNLWLISSEQTPVSSEQKPISSEVTTTPPAESTQNEIKGNGSKSIIGAAEAAASDQLPVDDGKKETRNKDSRRGISIVKDLCTLDEMREYFLEKLWNPKNPGNVYPDTIRKEAAKCWNHYHANGWRQGKGTGRPIKQWKGSANTWIINFKDGTYSNPSSSTPPPPEKKRQDDPQQPRTTELNVMSRGINFLFERFREAPEEVTISSIEISDYDYLKRQKKIAFTQDQIDAIKKKAGEEISSKKLVADEGLLLTYMKKVAVIEFFKLQQEQGTLEIFSNN